MRISVKQETFCQEYVKTGNATQSYLKAGYTTKNENTAGVQSNRMLRTPKIQARIAELQQHKSDRNQVDADRIVKELAAIAFANFTDIANYDNNSLTLISSEELPENIKPAIAEVTIINNDKFDKTSIKMHDKVKALNSLAAIMGMTSDFNIAIATLKKYGLVVTQEGGKWSIGELKD